VADIRQPPLVSAGWYRFRLPKWNGRLSTTRRRMMCPDGMTFILILLGHSRTVTGRTAGQFVQKAGPTHWDGSVCHRHARLVDLITHCHHDAKYKVRLHGLSYKLNLRDVLLTVVRNLPVTEFSSVPVLRRRDARPCCCGLKPPARTVPGSQWFWRVLPKRNDSCAR